MPTTTHQSTFGQLVQHPHTMIALVIVLTGIWASATYGPGLWSWSALVYQSQQLIAQSASHPDQARVVSLFVGDYVTARQGGPTKRLTGYASPLAAQPSPHAPGLKAAVQSSYKRLAPGFDPLLCGSRLPSSATFDADITGASVGQSSVTVRFLYPDSPSESTATYLLTMTPGSRDGWKIIGVNCVTLDHDPSRPFVLAQQPDYATSIESPLQFNQ
ncbi:MAG TPA: hypothetical protein VLI05_05170 [Candidatus Saccharimonadia bacterium]|nr:hypothetical protein [Candidatus Saccharimonadia bacterium]